MYIWPSHLACYITYRINILRYTFYRVILSVLCCSSAIKKCSVSVTIIILRTDIDRGQCVRPLKRWLDVIEHPHEGHRAIIINYSQQNVRQGTLLIKVEQLLHDLHSQVLVLASHRHHGLQTDLAAASAGDLATRGSSVLLMVLALACAPCCSGGASN